jgi:succinoglycan biosynthesis transport protein ExoP
MANEALRLIGGPEVSLGSTSEDLNLRELWRAMRRRRSVLLLTVLLITGGTFAYVHQLTPTYTAEALIHVQNRDAQVVQIPGVVDQLVADPATIESETQLLTSRSFLRRNVEQLNLVDDPEFNPSLLKDGTEPSLDRGQARSGRDPAELRHRSLHESGRGPSERAFLRHLAILHVRRSEQGR